MYEFRTMRTRLHYAEQELENRSECFDPQADARDRKMTNSEDEETATEFDMRLLTETQRQTRRDLKAEESYEAAKAALIGAGLRNRLGSELSSGFADDPDNGYKLSFEQDMQSSIDLTRIQAWLDGIGSADAPISNAQTEAPSGVLQSAGPGADGVDVDKWDAKSVELCDSSSMVAEGTWRKRNDRWNAAYGMA